MRYLLSAIFATAVLLSGIALAQRPAPPKSSTKPSPPHGTKDNAPPLKIDGYVKDAAGKPIFGATVSTAGSISVTTDHSGHYLMKSLDRSASVYIVRAVHKDFTFQPNPAKVSVPKTGDASGVNFTGTAKSTKK